MNDFPELMPWDELTTTVKRLSQILDDQASALWQEIHAMKIQVDFFAKQFEALKNECFDLRVEVEGLRDFSYNSREQIDAFVNLQEEFLKTNKAVSFQNVAFQEQINTLKNEQAETKELVYCLEKQVDALEKVVADMLATSPLPEMEIVAVVDEIK